MPCPATRLPVLCLSAALAGACSTSAIAPDTRDRAVPAAWARGGEPGAVAPAWLGSFADTRLEALVTEAVAHNFRLGQERQQLALARQAVVVARADRFPALDLSLDGSRRGSEDTAGARLTSDSYDAALGARWDVDLWQRLGRRQQAAELEYASGRARLQSAERGLAGETAGRYFDVLEAQQLLEVAARRLDNAIESHDIVASGYRQGLNDALDLYLARNQVERERANHALQEQALLEAAGDLQISLARYPDGALTFDGELPVLDEPIPAGLPSDLLARRPDIQAAWLDLLAADAELAASHKARFPSLVLVGSSGVASTEFSELLDGGVSAWSVAFGLTQQLFDAGRLRALEEQALARVRSAEQAYLELLYSAFADVENAISRSASLASRYEALLEAQSNARVALELALEQYQRGLVPYTTVLESQRQAFDAEATVVQLANQRLQNRIALHLSLGGAFAEMNQADETSAQ